MQQASVAHEVMVQRNLLHMQVSDTTENASSSNRGTDTYLFVTGIRRIMILEVIDNDRVTSEIHLCRLACSGPVCTTHKRARVQYDDARDIGGCSHIRCWRPAGWQRHHWTFNRVVLGREVPVLGHVCVCNLRTDIAHAVVVAERHVPRHA